ncbi:hypothetical protein, partial [Streptomyces javensis]|uniref:hypothetical protein n=1 Tax=Streptomyces javensis TaxID=114698 RepID=UPI001BE480D2
MYLPAQAINGNAARRDIETAHNGGNGLDLMVTQFHGHSRVLLFAEGGTQSEMKVRHGEGGRGMWCLIPDSTQPSSVMHHSRTMFPPQGDTWLNLVPMRRVVVYAGAVLMNVPGQVRG